MNTQAEQQSPPHPQADTTPPSVMTVPEQTEDSPPIALVNQNDERPTFHTTHPYLRRGAQFSNGCRCYGRQVFVLFAVGGIMVILGFGNYFIVGRHTGAFMLVIGGVVLGLGVWLLRTAKAQFNSLPLDHPDRVKYTTRRVRATPNSGDGRGNQCAYAYTVPPLQHQVMPRPSPPGGQVVYYPAQPGWQGQAYAPLQPAVNPALPSGTNPALPPATNPIPPPAPSPALPPEANNTPSHATDPALTPATNPAPPPAANPPPLHATNLAPTAPVMYGDHNWPSTRAAPSNSWHLQNPYIPENDPPPSYWDVVKNA